MKLIMKKKFSFILFFATVLFVVGCQGERGKEVLEESKISIEVIMPKPLSFEGVKGSIGYYWNNNLTFHLVLSQNNEEKKIISLKPNYIPSEGDKVHFEVKLPQEEYDFSMPITLSGCVVVGEGESISVGGGKLIYPHKFGGLLPYDILEDLNQPLCFDAITINPKKLSNELSVNLKPQGQLVLLQIHNGNKETITLNTLSLTTIDESFLGDDGKYLILKNQFEGHTFDKSSLFGFPNKNKVSTDISNNYIIWLPNNNLSGISLNLEYATEDESAITCESASPTALTKKHALVFVSLKKGEEVVVDNQPKVDESDTSEGGDPLFTMNEIEFWVGEGENRAALVIEWHDGKQPDAIVWGYRWDGEKTGFDMVKAIVQADPRLSIVMGKAFGGLEVIGGIGYQFAIANPRASVLLDGEKLANNGNGITFVDNAKDFDNYIFSDSKGHWKSGWYTQGYWVYYVKDNRLDSWSYSQLVYSLRNLVDGCWDGWSFQDGMDSYTGRPHGNKFLPAPLPN